VTLGRSFRRLSYHVSTQDENGEYLIMPINIKKSTEILFPV